MLDSGQTTITEQSNVIGFYTWGSNAVIAKSRHFNHTSCRERLARNMSAPMRAHSGAARQLRSQRHEKSFGGSHQSLIGDLFVTAFPQEPRGRTLLNGTIRPDILFPAYVRVNPIESFYLDAAVSWQTIVVGDVLCAPFGPKALQTSDLNWRSIPTPNFLRFFRLGDSRCSPGSASSSARHGCARKSNGEKEPSSARGARAGNQDRRRIRARATRSRAALSTGQGWIQAIERYQLVIEKNPTHATALNNLA